MALKYQVKKSSTPTFRGFAAIITDMDTNPQKNSKKRRKPAIDRPETESDDKPQPELLKEREAEFFYGDNEAWYVIGRHDDWLG